MFKKRKNPVQTMVTAAIVFLTLVVAISAQSTSQRATLVKSLLPLPLNIAPKDFLRLNGSAQPDLGDNYFDNAAHSTCITGIRLFYNNPNFNAKRGTVEYVYGESNECVNLKYLGGKVTSTRLAGLPSDYTANTVTLYQGDYFQGPQEFTMTDRPTLTTVDGQVSSVIVTGPTPWTFYTLPNYQGEATCVVSMFPTPAFVYDTEQMGVRRNSIRSIRLGCFVIGQGQTNPGSPTTNTDDIAMNNQVKRQTMNNNIRKHIQNLLASQSQSLIQSQIESEFQYLLQSQMFQQLIQSQMQQQQLEQHQREVEKGAQGQGQSQGYQNSNQNQNQFKVINGRSGGYPNSSPSSVQNSNENSEAPQSPSSSETPSSTLAPNSTPTQTSTQNSSSKPGGYVYPSPDPVPMPEPEPTPMQMQNQTAATTESAKSNSTDTEAAASSSTSYVYPVGNLNPGSLTPMQSQIQALIRAEVQAEMQRLIKNEIPNMIQTLNDNLNQIPSKSGNDNKGNQTK